MWDVLLTLGLTMVIVFAVLGVIVVASYIRLNYLLWKKERP